MNASSAVITWPAPEGEVASPDYHLEVGGVPVFVYQARVRAEIIKEGRLASHRMGCGGETASFAIFDIRDKVAVTVKPQRAFRTATLLPARAGITPGVEEGSVRFEIDQPRPLTLLLDDGDEAALHLLVGHPEKDIPKPDDAGVVYFGPGIHEIQALPARSGQTIYLAGGAVVKAVLRPGEQGQYNERWNIQTYPGVLFDLRDVENVRIAGRGILDGSLVPHPGRNLIGLTNSRRVQLSGITLRDAPNWNVRIQNSEDVVVDDLRIVSGRLNSDGINSVSSRRVEVRNCFVRNHDDSIVAKALDPAVSCEDITVEDCVIWNDWGYALGATYETRSPIRRLRFRRCDILCARHWAMGIHVSDSATVSDVVFEDITVDDPRRYKPQPRLTAQRKLFRMVVIADHWGRDNERGHIANIRAERVTLEGEALLPSEFRGFDAGHAIEDVALRDVRCRHRAAATDAASLGVIANEFVRGLRVEASGE